MAKLTPAGRAPWILSRGVDITLIVGAPLLSVALLLPLARVVSSRSIWVAVMAFGAVGHHLPGFLRTYGDRALFRQYRLRFLVAPPLVFGATLAFALRDLHGVALVALVWSAWHGMMQHYGFVRIYEAKVHAPSRFMANLDFSMALSWFAVCLLFSPNMGGSIIDALQTARLALPSPGVLQATRQVALAATVVTTVLYVGVTARARLAGGDVSRLKLALLATTTALVWFARVVTADPYLSVALFEVLHDVQYLAIVWAFNRRLVETGQDRTGLARALFSARLGSLGAYVGVCLAYGAVAFVAYTSPFAGVGQTVLISLLVTSGLLHYYYDGFIWKLRRPETRAGLALDDQPGMPSLAPARTFDRRAFVHAALFVLGVALLALVERRAPALDGLEAAQAVVSLVPGNPTSQANVGSALLERGRVQDALPHLREAARLMPTADTRARLGGALVATGAVDEGVTEAERALRIDPAFGEAHAVLGHAHLRQGAFPSAISDYRSAIRLGAGAPLVHANLGYALTQLGQFDEAERELRTALTADPRLAGGQINLGLLLDQAGHTDAALPYFDEAVRLRPDSAEAHNDRGIALYKLGRRDEAVGEFGAALRADPGFEPAKRNLEGASR